MSTRNQNFQIDEEKKKYIRDSIELFKKKEKEGFETRYKSWQNCHKFFLGLHEKYKSTGIKFEEMQDAEQELALLHLSCYLASWGMYRGSSFILQYDNTIFEKVIDIIFETKYLKLWDLKFDEIEKHTSDIKNLLLSIGKGVSGVLLEYRDFCNTKNFSYSKEYKEYFYGLSEEQKEEFISQTLTTKILLGTMCCCPAYDKFFSEGIGGTFNQFFDEKRLGNLLEKIKQNEVFSQLSDETGYPLMKIVDMAYFNIGMEKEFKGYYDHYIQGKYKVGEQIQVRGNRTKTDSWKDVVKALKQFYYRLDEGQDYDVHVAFECEKDKVDKFIGDNKKIIGENLKKLAKEEEKEKY